MDMQRINPGIIEQYRRAGGQLVGALLGLPVLLLTTTGRRSGMTHTTPLGYVRDGDRLAVAASAGGAPTNPDWYHNLITEPYATVELGTTTYEAQATVARGAERDRLLDRLVAALPRIGDYAAAVEREVPVVVLSRRLDRGDSLGRAHARSAESIGTDR